MSKQRYVQTDLETADLIHVAEGCDDSLPVRVYDEQGNAYSVFEVVNEGGQLVINLKGPESWAREAGRR